MDIQREKWTNFHNTLVMHPILSIDVAKCVIDGSADKNAMEHQRDFGNP